MQVESTEDTRRRMGARHREEPVPDAASGGPAHAEHLARELIEAFADDYSEGGKDHALAELLFSVRGLKTPYDRWAAATALESLAERIEAGFGEYPNLIRAAETLIGTTPAGDEGRERALHTAEKVIRLVAAELSKSTR